MTEIRYLGGFVGSKAAQYCWLWEKVEFWRDPVANLARVELRHPQTPYASLQKSLQQEWAFVKHVTPDIGMAFQVTEYALQYILLSDLFQGATS